MLCVAGAVDRAIVVYNRIVSEGRLGWGRSEQKTNPDSPTKTTHVGT